MSKRAYSSHLFVGLSCLCVLTEDLKGRCIIMVERGTNLKKKVICPFNVPFSVLFSREKKAVPCEHIFGPRPISFHN